MLDVEENGVTKAHVEAFVAEFEVLTGAKPAIYTSRYKWGKLVGSTNWAGNQPLWVADWNRNYRGKPRLPGDWNTWEFQQTGSNGQVAGIGGRVNPVQQVSFAVTLPHNGFHAQLVCLALYQRHQLVVGGAAVDIRLAAA